jgi:hyperosmotically inducible protein
MEVSMPLHRRIVILLFALVITTACAKTVSGTIDDATITTRVKTVFINDPLIGGLRIDVDTFKGVVTLSGRVSNEQEQQKAIELARKVRGVVDVKSNLQIQ